MENHIITSIYINVKTNEVFTEKEQTMLHSMLLHTCAWSANGGVFLNPPQKENEDPSCIFELDLVFEKAISIEDGEQILKFLPIKIRSVFINAKLDEPIVELKEHIVSV
ncbi:MAG: hypothetical protein ACO1OT_16120 [Heyndrickxia sp.]